jgi:hypothetical protein
MDSNDIPKLIANANSPQALAQAQAQATQALIIVGVKFPHNACAATLSALLQASGINVPMTLGAGKLAHILGGSINSRNWTHIPVGQQRAGDVGVCFDDDTSIPGSDHVYLVAEAINHDEMIIADNQKPTKHRRCASGKDCGEGKKTATEYFLRAS